MSVERKYIFSQIMVVQKLASILKEERLRMLHCQKNLFRGTLSRSRGEDAERRASKMNESAKRENENFEKIGPDLPSQLEYRLSSVFFIVLIRGGISIRCYVFVFIVQI